MNSFGFGIVAWAPFSTFTEVFSRRKGQNNVIHIIHPCTMCFFCKRRSRYARNLTIRSFTGSLTQYKTVRNFVIILEIQVVFVT